MTAKPDNNISSKCLSTGLGTRLTICSICSIYIGPSSVPTLSCVALSEDISGAVNVNVSCTLSGGDSADFYLISITTNAPQTPDGELLNITTGSVTQHELTSFMTAYEYITVHGVNCGSQEGTESEPLDHYSTKYIHTCISDLINDQRV